MATLSIESEFLTPPEVAELLRVSHSKVLTWIGTGDLRASDLASHRGQRPRWKIAKSDLELFLARRAATPEPKPQRRRKRSDDTVIEFYK